MQLEEQLLNVAGLKLVKIEIDPKTKTGKLVFETDGINKFQLILNAPIGFVISYNPMNFLGKDIQAIIGEPEKSKL